MVTGISPILLKLVPEGIELYEGTSLSRKLPLNFSKRILLIQFPRKLQEENWLTNCLFITLTAKVPTGAKDLIASTKPPGFAYTQEFTNKLIKMTCDFLYMAAEKQGMSPPFLQSPSLSVEYLRKHFNKPRPAVIAPYKEFLTQLQDGKPREHAAAALPREDFQRALSYAELVV